MTNKTEAPRTLGPGSSAELTETVNNECTTKSEVFNFCTEDDMANGVVALEQPIVEGLIYPGTMGMIVAAPKVGKTNFFMEWVHYLAKGENYNGFVTKRRPRVLIEEIEEGEAAVATRYQRMKLKEEDKFDNHGFVLFDKVPSTSFEFETQGDAYVVKDDAGMALHINEWSRQVDELWPDGCPKVVFIDTLIRAIPQLGGGKYGKELNCTGAVHNWAESKGYALVFIHHTNKAVHADDADTINGTNGILGSMDWFVKIKRDVQDGRRLSTAKFVWNSRLGEDGVRDMILSDNGFWRAANEDDLHKRDTVMVPADVKKVVEFVKAQGEWHGTATDLVRATGVGVASNAITRQLNKWRGWIADEGVLYGNSRTGATRKLSFVRADGQVPLSPTL